ncbi:MAG: hypothetical protein K6F35_06600 [Lachnospiraceae bacterium]|nr:hypothetical protein [Lachnospiraceae bacterium]
MCDTKGTDGASSTTGASLLKSKGKKVTFGAGAGVLGEGLKKEAAPQSRMGTGAPPDAGGHGGALPDGGNPAVSSGADSSAAKALSAQARESLDWKNDVLDTISGLSLSDAPDSAYANEIRQREIEYAKAGLSYSAYRPKDPAQEDDTLKLARMVDTVRIFDQTKQVTSKGLRKRERRLKKKQQRFSTEAVQDWRMNGRSAAFMDQWRADHEAELQAELDEERQNSSPLTESDIEEGRPTAGRVRKHKETIQALISCQTDFLGYADDTDFVKDFEVNLGTLNSFAALKEVMENCTQQTLNAVLLNSYPVEELKKAIGRYEGMRDFYLAKMDIISSPFYMVLSKEDTEYATPELLERKAQECRDAGRDELAEYLDAVKRLKELEKNKTKRESEGLGVFRSARKDASGRFTGSAALFTKKTETQFRVLGAKMSGPMNSEFGTPRDRSKENMTDEEKAEMKKNETSYKVDLLNASASAQVKLAELKGQARNRSGTAKIQAEASFLDVRAEGSVGAYLGIRDDGELTGGLGASAKVSGAVAKGKVGASLQTPKFGKDKSMEEGFLAAGLEASGEVLSASAEASAKIGWLKEGEGFSAKVGIDAYASLLSGRAKGFVTIAGVKIGASISGDVGAVGINLGGYIKNGKAGGSIGAALGLGARLNIEVDFSYWTEKFKKWAKGKYTDHKKKQTDEKNAIGPLTGVKSFEGVRPEIMEAYERGIANLLGSKKAVDRILEDARPRIQEGKDYAINRMTVARVDPNHPGQIGDGVALPEGIRKTQKMQMALDIKRLLEQGKKVVLSDSKGVKGLRIVGIDDSFEASYAEAFLDFSERFMKAKDGKKPSVPSLPVAHAQRDFKIKVINDEAPGDPRQEELSLEELLRVEGGSLQLSWVSDPAEIAKKHSDFVGQFGLREDAVIMEPPKSRKEAKKGVKPSPEASSTTSKKSTTTTTTTTTGSAATPPPVTVTKKNDAEDPATPPPSTVTKKDAATDPATPPPSTATKKNDAEGPTTPPPVTATKKDAATDPATPPPSTVTKKDATDDPTSPPPSTVTKKNDGEDPATPPPSTSSKKAAKKKTEPSPFEEHKKEEPKKEEKKAPAKPVPEKAGVEKLLDSALLTIQTFGNPITNMAEVTRISEDIREQAVRLRRSGQEMDYTEAEGMIPGVEPLQAEEIISAIKQEVGMRFLDAPAGEQPDAKLAAPYEKQPLLSNNCWCCSGAALFNQFLSLRGELSDQTRVSQFDLRHFRIPKEEWRTLEEARAMTKEGTKDEDIMIPYFNAQEDLEKVMDPSQHQIGNIFEMADFFLQRRKDLYMTEMTFNVGKEKQKGIEKAFCDSIREVLATGNLVSLLDGEKKHYITITEIDDQNQITYLNSMDAVGKMKHTATPDQLLKEGRTIKLAWMSALKSPEEMQAEHPGLVLDSKGEFQYHGDKAMLQGGMVNLVQKEGICIEEDAHSDAVEARGWHKAVYIPKHPDFSTNPAGGGGASQ